MPNRSVFAIAAALALGCAATRQDASAGAAGPPARVSLQDHRTGGRLSLVNDAELLRLGIPGATADTRRTAYYSTTRRDATTKITTDEVMGALLEYFEDQGFDRIALGGSAPPGGAEVSQSLEVLVEGSPRYALARRGMEVRAARTFRACRDAFVALYNQTYQLQSVETRPGEPVFETPDPRGGR